jgi:hypothetical protein
VSDLHDVKTVDTRVSLFLTEGKKTIFVGGVAFGERQFHEAASIAFKDLSLFALDVVKLHEGLDILLVGRVEAHDETPLASVVHVVVHDLAGGHLGRTVEHLDCLALLRSIDVPDGVFAHDGQSVSTNPAPKDSSVSDLTLKNLLGLFHVEYLHDCCLTVGSADSNDILLLVHKGTVRRHIATVNLKSL